MDVFQWEQFVNRRRCMIACYTSYSPHLEFDVPFTEFLGDKISSYGGKLRFTLSFVGDEHPRLEFPLVRILGNSILALDYHPADAPMPIPEDNVFEVLMILCEPCGLLVY